MARTYDAIDATMAQWISRQPMFFVGTAPLGGGGHVNVSPKGPIGTLKVLGARRVAYLDYYQTTRNASSIDGLPAVDVP